MNPVHQLSDVGKTADFGGLKPNLECPLDLHQELDVRQRIPAGHVSGGALTGQRQTRQIEMLRRNLTEPGENFRRIHSSPLKTLPPPAFAPAAKGLSLPIA